MTYQGAGWKAEKDGDKYQEREADRQDGPRYDINSAALGKHRQAAKDGLSSLTRAEVVAYAKAVEAAVFASQTAWMKGGPEKPVCPSNSASGTYHSRGEDIHAAIRSKQRAALAAAPGRERRARTPAQWEAMYAEAMANKPKPIPPAPDFGICGYIVVTTGGAHAL